MKNEKENNGFAQEYLDAIVNFLNVGTCNWVIYI